LAIIGLGFVFIVKSRGKMVEKDYEILEKEIE
jgi:hypothetical protein